MSETGASSVCHVCGHTNEMGSRFCAGCRTQLLPASDSSLVARWRARARLRRTLIRAAAAVLVLLVVSWVAVENIGLARFLPDPASDLTSEPRIGGWPTEGGSPLRANTIPEAATSLAGDVAWKADLGASPGGGPVVLEDVVYAGDVDGCMHAFSAPDGAPLWDRCLEAPISSTPSIAGHLVYFGTLDGRVTALGRDDGSVVWTFQADAPVRSSPAVANGVLYAGSSDRRLYALDALTGEERWSFATEGRITSGPAVNEQLVVVVSQDNLIHFIDRHTAKRWFDYETSLADGSVAIAGDSVYAADISGTIRRVRWDNREWPFEKSTRNVRQWMFRWGMANELPPQKGVVWVRQERGESFTGTPAVDAEKVYATTAGGTVFAYDKETGVPLWQAHLDAPAATSPTVIGNEVVVGTRTGMLASVDSATGEMRWRIQPGDGAVLGIAAGADALYATGASGMLVEIR